MEWFMKKVRSFLRDKTRRHPDLDLTLPLADGKTKPASRVLESDDEVTQWFVDHRSCPDCGSLSFLEGPKGGASQNIECATPGCRSRFNVLVVNGHFLFAQRINRIGRQTKLH